MTGHVDSAVEVWLLVAVNFFGVLMGAVVTAISYVAYRTHGRKTSLRNATAGFSLLTLGTAIEPLYQLSVAGTHVLASDRNIPLKITEGAVISLGFVLLFFSVYRYRSSTRRQTISVSGVDDELLDDVD